jgi:hypothetical protein
MRRTSSSGGETVRDEVILFRRTAFSKAGLSRFFPFLAQAGGLSWDKEPMRKTKRPT